jgi:hypothetical protein
MSRLLSGAPELLAGERAIDLGDVEKSDAAFHRRADQGDHLSAVRRRAAVMIQPMQPRPTAETSSPLVPSLLFCISFSNNPRVRMFSAAFARRRSP